MRSERLSLTFIYAGTQFNWDLIAAWIVKRMDVKRFRLLIGVAELLVDLATLTKIIL